MLAPETILQGRYRIVGPLGQGGMGAVYEAIDLRLDAVVALKETLFAEERLRKQFEREARLLAGLHHPALPRVSDHFNEGDGEFLVMQFITGADLSAMMEQRTGPFPAAEVLKWADQLLDALDYLHTQDPQIIHRDIKPQNLKITARGQIVLLDFGLAKGSVGQMTAVTTSASIFGYTPNYAPLEQVRGLGTDSRSDLYSLAATIYHLMTGVKPPDALSRAGSLVDGQPDPLLAANEVALQVNAATAAVLAKGMAQNRDQRYATAAEMRVALSAASQAAATATDRDAATVLLDDATLGATAGVIGSELPTAIAGDQRTMAAFGNSATTPQTPAPETITRMQSGVGGSSSAGWKVAIAAGVLLACAGGFYGYRAIRDRAQANGGTTVAQPTDPNARPQPVTESFGALPAVQEPRDVNKAPASGDGTTDRTAAAKANEPKRTGVNPAKPADARQDNPPTTPTAPNTGGTGQSANTNSFPQQPTNSTEPNSRGDRPQRMPGGGILRTLPDGTQILTRPDGTRIVRRPNGATRVLEPGERPNQRPNQRPNRRRFP